MPQQTVYIRQDDLERWKQLPNKAEFIHNALNGIENGTGEPEDIEEQLEALGLDYYQPGKAWSRDREKFVSYTVDNGEVVL